MTSTASATRDPGTRRVVPLSPGWAPTLREGFGQTVSPWQGEGRPGLLSPMIGEIQPPDPVFEAYLPRDEPGTFEIWIVANGPRYLRVGLGSDPFVDFSAAGLAVPEGPAKVWTRFVPADGSPARFSGKVEFDVRAGARIPRQRLDRRIGRYRILGPTSSWSIFGQAAVLWDGPDRPLLITPQGGASVPIDVVFEGFMASEAAGTYELWVFARGPVYLRVMLGADPYVDLSELGVVLPEGEARAWIRFLPEGGPARFSAPVAFSVVASATIDRRRQVRRVNGVRLLGPVFEGSNLIQKSLPIWRRGNRPHIAEPYDHQSVETRPRFVLSMPEPEPGEFSIELRMDTGDRATAFFFAFLGEARKIDFEDFEHDLPEGKVTAYATFKARNGEIRRSLKREFSIARSNRRVVQNAYPEIRERFYRNLDTLSYDDNLVLLRDEIAAEKTVLSAMPTFIQMSVGHVCNLDCIMCSTGRNPDRTPLPDGVLKDFPRLFPFLDRIVVQGGEPLMFRNIRDLLMEARNYPQLAISIGTNGVLLKHGWLDLVLDGRYDLNISIDACTEETYGKIRRKGNWKDLIDAVEYIKVNRKSNYPHIYFSMCIMRSNIDEIVPFVDFAFRSGAQSLYYNLMWPVEIDKGYEHENVFGDKDALRRIVHAMRAARKRASDLGLACEDKVLGYIFPDHPEFVLDEEDLTTLNAQQKQAVRASLAANRETEDAYWAQEGGGHPQYPLPPSIEERGFNVPKDGKWYPQRPERPEYTLQDGFFCTYPFHILNFDIENTYVCCHAHRPYSAMSYGVVSGVFDVWNHPLMQKVRETMFDGSAAEQTCHTRCPHYRYGGYKQL